MPERRIDVPAVAVGVAGGLASGLLGVGGGIVIVPGALLFLHMAQRRAHAASLAAILPVGIVGALVYMQREHISYPVAGLLALGSVVGAPIGVRALSGIHPLVLRVLFVATAVAFAVRLLTTAGTDRILLVPESLDATDIVVSIVTGVVAGAFGGLLGVGGGIIMVPAMTILLEQTQHVAQGTSLLAIVATAAAGTVANARRDNLDVPVAVWLAVGGVTGAVAGASLAGRLADATLRRGFAVLLIVVAVRMLVSRRPAEDAST